MDEKGIPWIVSASGDVFRRTTNDLSGSWEVLPRPPYGGATDIAIHSRLDSITPGSRAGGYAWVASGAAAHAWNEQDAISGNNAAPARALWVRARFTMPDNILGIAVNSSGNPSFALNGGVYTVTR